jgi:hypothetical protein
MTAPQQTIKDETGSIFMEETTKPQPQPKKPNGQINLQDVGVQVDSQGKIIPLLNPGAPPVQKMGSKTEAYTEYFVPTPYGSVPIYGSGFPWTQPYVPGFYPGYYPGFGLPYGGYPGGTNIGIGIGGRRFGVGLGLNTGMLGLPYPGSGYPGLGYGGVPFSVAPFGVPTPMPYAPVIYGNGTLDVDASFQQSVGLPIGPTIGTARGGLRSRSTPFSYNSSQYISTPWLDSSSNYGGRTSILAPLLH